MLALISHIPNPLQDSLFSPEQPVRFSLAESVCQESGGKIRNPAKGCIKDEAKFSASPQSPTVIDHE